ncbi:hypothetical protein BTVI_149204 [Pitangus sulphuratus]|nr:hypothetical protein BTVI_149204 [Pitangus sulphuratus]
MEESRVAFPLETSQQLSTAKEMHKTGSGVVPLESPEDALLLCIWVTSRKQGDEDELKARRLESAVEVEANCHTAGHLHPAESKKEDMIRLNRQEKKPRALYLVRNAPLNDEPRKTHHI